MSDFHNTLLSKIASLSKGSGSQHENEVVMIAKLIDDDIKSINRQRKIESSLNGEHYVEMKAENHEMFNYFCVLSRKHIENNYN